MQRVTLKRRKKGWSRIVKGKVETGAKEENNAVINAFFPLTVIPISLRIIIFETWRIISHSLWTSRSKNAFEYQTCDGNASVKIGAWPIPVQRLIWPTRESKVEDISFPFETRWGSTLSIRAGRLLHVSRRRIIQRGLSIFHSERADRGVGALTPRVEKRAAGSRSNLSSRRWPPPAASLRIADSSTVSR